MVSWWIPRATIRRLLRAFMEHLDVDVPDDAIDKAIDDFIEGRTAVTTDRGGQAGDTSTTSTRTTISIPNAPVSGEQIVAALDTIQVPSAGLRGEPDCECECDGSASCAAAEHVHGCYSELADVVFMLPERETSIEQLAADTTVTVEVDGAQVEVEGTIESRDER